MGGAVAVEVEGWSSFVAVVVLRLLLLFLLLLVQLLTAKGDTIIFLHRNATLLNTQGQTLGAATWALLAWRGSN